MPEEPEKFEIRNAEPGDAGAVAKLIYMADTGYTGISGWDIAFREPEEKIIEKLKWLYLNAESIYWHYSNFIVAVVDGRVVGAISIFGRDHNRYIPWWKSLREMGLSRRQMLTYIWRVLPFLRVNPNIPRGTLVIESGAILPEHRGLGIPYRGFKDALEKARREGYKKLQAAVYIGNLAPQIVCERLGFKVQDEYRSRSFERKFGSPGMKRLVYEVEPEDSQ